MKRYIFSIIFIVLLIAFSFLWWLGAVRPVSNLDEEVRFVIPKGRSALVVANNLEEEGLIRSSLAFKFYVQLTGNAKKIKAGAFDISPNLSLYQIVELLKRGPTQVWVTIPEGLRREEIVERFIKGLEKEEEAEDFRAEFLNLTATKEGYLFPDTYLFERTATADLVVKTMTTVFDKKISEFGQAISQSRLSEREAVILASIIERESRSDEERPLVAGVLLNRLEIGMGLQADATVQYAAATRACGGARICEWWKGVSSSDLETNSPYNTYKYAGLPPGAISNPGLSSLKAAFLPEDNDYLYYLHDKEGEIHFAKTLAEHNLNVSRYLR